MRVTVMRLPPSLLLALVTACSGGGGGSHDTQPNSFSFTAEVDVAVGAAVDSPAVTISGIDAPAAVSIVGGQYAIDGGAFKSAGGSISNGQSLVVRVMASTSTNTSVSATVTVGGVSATFTVTTVPDTTPTALGPFDVAGVALDAVVDFPAVTIDGIDVPVPISITGGEYAIDGGMFTAATGTIESGQSIVVRVVASSVTYMPVTATVTVGGVDVNFTATTLPDTLPDAFSFVDQTDVARGAVVDSGAVVISGIDVPVPVSIVAGQYSIDGGSFRGVDGMIAAGQSLELRLVADAVPGGTASAAVMVGDGSAVWEVTTLPDTTAPTATITFPPPLSRTSGDTVYLRGTAADDMSTVAAIRVNGIDAATSDAYANWTATVPVVPGDNVLQVQTQDTVGNLENAAAQITVVRNGRFGVPAGIAYDAGAEVAYVVDSGMRGLWAVDLAAGAAGLRTIVSGGGAPNGLDTFAIPVSVALDGNRALVLDSSLGAILSVDLATGARTIFSDASTPDSLNPFVSLQDMVLDAPGDRLLVLDDAAGPSGSPAVLAVGLADGARTIVSDSNTPNATNLFQNARAIALDSARNRALVATANPNAVYDVSLTDGTRAILSDASTPNGSNPLTFPSSITVDAANARALVGQPETRSIMAVDLAGGSRTVFSGPFFPDSADVFDSPRAMAVDAMGDRVLVLDDTNRRIYAADLGTGARTILSPDDPPSVALPFLDPSGIMLDPANNRALVSDTERDAIVAMDLDTLDLTIFSNNATPSSANPLYWPARIVGDLASNRAFVLDKGRAAIAAPRVLALDLTTGARTLVTSDTFPDTNNPLKAPFGIAFDETRSRLLVSDVDLATVFAVDVDSGVRTIFSDNATPDASNPFAAPQPIVIDAVNDRALIGNSTSSLMSSLLGVDPATGARMVLSGFGIPDVDNWFSDPVGLALDEANDRLLLMDRQVQQLLSIDLTQASPTTGTRTVISNNLAPYTENPIGGPEGVAYDPGTGILYVADDWFDAVVAIDVVTGHRVYLMR